MTQTASMTPLDGAEAPPLPGEAGLVPLEEARAYDPQATWNRHALESWAMIAEEYKAGATAKQLAVKWRVAPTSIYRHAYQEGWSKKAQAKRVAAAALERAEAAEEMELQLTVFAPEAASLPPLDEEAGTPEETRRLALAAAAQCLRRGRHAEAERLGRLAETLNRLIPPPPRDAWSENDARLIRVWRLETLQDRINALWDMLTPQLEQTGLFFPFIELVEMLVERAGERKEAPSPASPVLPHGVGEMR